MRSLLFIILFLSFNYTCQSQYSIYAKGGASWRTAINLPGEFADFTVQYGERKYLTRGYTQFSAIGFQYDLVAFDFLDKNWKILSDTEMNYYGRVELLPALLSITQSVSIQYNHGRRSYFSIGPSVSLLLINRDKNIVGDNNKYKYFVPGITTTLSIDLIENLRVGVTSNIETKPHLIDQSFPVYIKRFNLAIALYYSIQPRENDGSK